MAALNHHPHGGRQRGIIYLSPLIGISLLSLYFNRTWMLGVSVHQDHEYDKPIPEVRKTSHKATFPELESVFDVVIPDEEEATSTEDSTSSEDEESSDDSEEDSSSGDSEEDSSDDSEEDSSESTRTLRGRNYQ